MEVYNSVFFEAEKGGSLFQLFRFCSSVILILLYATGLALSGCATSQRVRIDEGAPPEKLQDEDAKYYEISKQMVETLENEGAVWRDPWFQEKGLKLISSMVPPELRDDRAAAKAGFYLVKFPTVNAFAIHSGDIFFHTGLIAKTTHRDQLIFIAGHELSHWVNRDVIYYVEDMRNKTITAQIFDLILAPADAFVGAGGLGILGLNLIYAATVTGFSREQEARADVDALKNMLEAGYDPTRATETFLIFMEQHEKYGGSMPPSFLLSHPQNKQRIEAVTELLRAKGLEGSQEITMDKEYILATRHIRLENALLNIRYGYCFNALDDIKTLLDVNPSDSEALVLRGEACREMTGHYKRAKEELSENYWVELYSDDPEDRVRQTWQEESLKAFEASLELQPDLPDAHRGLGRLYADWPEHSGHRSKAMEHLKKYLKLKPGAWDKRFIKCQIKALEEADDAAN